MNFHRLSIMHSKHISEHKLSVTDDAISTVISDEMDIYWICLAEKCPKNCCGKHFDNGKVVNIYNLHHDQVPLLPEEKDEIVRLKGPGCVKIEKDGLFYIDIPRQHSCPFLKDGRCDIEEIKPALCMAYPLIQLDCHVGPIFDHKHCPGFEEGKKLNLKMKKKDFIVMLKSFLELQQYRLDRIRLDLSRLSETKNSQ